MTYARLAQGLGLSESSVKRMFSLQSMSLDRLAQVCALRSLEITDLLELVRAAGARTVEHRGAGTHAAQQPQVAVSCRAGHQQLDGLSDARGV